MATEPSPAAFQERLKQERWEAEQNRANQAEQEPEPEPAKPARQMEPEPEPEMTYNEAYESSENPYEPADDPYSESQEVAEEPEAPASPPAQQHQPEPSPYEFEEEDNTYNQSNDEEAPAQSQGSLTAVALYDYQAGEPLLCVGNSRFKITLLSHQRS